jgi:hypothetical protein
MPEPRQKTTRKAGSAKKDSEYSRLIDACADLGMPVSQVLAWKACPDCIVILFKSGQKLIARQSP